MFECPDEFTLAGYVSGVLDEPAAVAVCEHLEQCKQCQSRVDDLAKNEDSLVTAMRRPSAGREEASRLDGLIGNAVQLRSTAKAVSESGKQVLPEGSAGVEVFSANLRKSGLIDSEDVDSLVDTINPDDSESFAKELVSQKKLTAFQAKAVLRGKWKGLVIGNYVVLDRLGQGGMGSVFKARHKRMGRTVCLKVLRTAGRKSPEMVERFRREARAVAALDHPNFVVAHDADESAEGIPYLVMELVEGRDLARYVQQDGPMNPDLAIKIIAQVAEALEYAHLQGMVHRDIKPHNLLLQESKRAGSSGSATLVKILDMGLARFDSWLGNNGDAITHASMTATGVVMGTVDYMAPEQAVNSRNASAQSDVYSLGCTLHFLLTGRPLFGGETIVEKLVAHRERGVPSLREYRQDVSPALDAIFQKMVAKKREDRYESMQEVAKEIQILMDGGKPAAMKTLREPSPPPPQPASRQEPQRQRRAIPPVWIGALVAAGVAMVVGVTLFFAVDWGGKSNTEPLEPSPFANFVPDPEDLKKQQPPKPRIVGHPNTLFNGGRGRALLVVPHDWFYEDQFQAMERELKKKRVEIVIGSSKAGYANPKHKKMEKVKIEMTLDRFNVNDFDAVFFVGGNHWEFTHKNKKSGAKAKSMIYSALSQKRVVATMSNAVGVLEDAGVKNGCNFEKKHECCFAVPKGKTGYIVSTGESKYARKLVSLVFDELLSPSSENNKKK